MFITINNNLLKSSNNDGTNNTYIKIFEIQDIEQMYNLGTTLYIIKTNGQHNVNAYNKTMCTNQFEIISRYSLYDISTYELFDLNITNNKYIVDFACKEGNIDF
nr:ankyrin repeat domain containing protein [Mimivirus sp.]